MSMVWKRFVARARPVAWALWICIGVALGLGTSGWVFAQAAASPGKLVWGSLSASEKQSLQPLQKEWHTLSADRQKKWLEVAARMPLMSNDERNRVSERMAEWARLTPSQRAQARLQFQEFRNWPTEDRQARWEAYLALSDAERSSLAGQAQRAPSTQARNAADRDVSSSRSEPKSNVIPPMNTEVTNKKTVAPTVVQIKPGASTQLISRMVAPPAHQQPGSPKIAATSDFVDPYTLLPKRGPQAAAMAISVGDATLHP